MLMACGAPVEPPSEAPRGTPGPGDGDGDGLNDQYEASLAREYLPYLSDHPDDECGLSGLVYRVRPHPADPALVAIVHVRVYHDDCGLNGHLGDDEVFGMTIDPRIPGPAGIVAMVAIGHQDTLCEQVTACGACPGQAACATATRSGQAVPVVFASKHKHANYVLADSCSLTACLDRCALAEAPGEIPMINAGEPGFPLVEDLTDHGFITADNGWTHPELMHLNPWDRSRKVGGGATGTVAVRLVDPRFVAAACSLPR